MRRYLIFLLIIAPLAGIVKAQNIELDTKLGEKNSKMVEEQMGIYDNKDMTTYLDKVGQKLVSHLENPLFKYQFKLVPDPSPNAFALPGGYVYVTTGILPLIETEDELAGIIGHEIIHSNDRHSVKQIRKGILPAILELPGNIVGVFSDDLGNLINAPIKTSNALLLASYSRKFETKADKFGVALAADAGYDPTALIDVLTRMNTAIEVITGNKETKSYFADHPYSPKRTKKLLKDTEDLTIKPSPKISENLVLQFDGVLFGNTPAKGVIRDNKFLHPDIDFLIEFPKDWQIANEDTKVASYAEDGNAALLLTIEAAGTSPQQAGKKFYDSLNDEYKKKATVVEAYDFKGNQGYSLSIKESSSKGTVYIDIFWLPLNKITYKILGLSIENHRQAVKESAITLRRLTANEKSSIMEHYIEVVEAKENETLEILSKRTQNILRLDLLSIINNHSQDDKLKKGEFIKIVSEKKYIIKSQ